MAEPKPLLFHIDDKPFSWNDLTYREKHEALKIVRDLSGDETLMWDFADAMYQAPAMIYVARKRNDASFTLDQALDSKDTDYFKVPAPEKRPTQRKTPAA